MYETYYGLRERPFELTPNPRFLLLTQGHRRALVNLELGIATRAGVVALIGEPGTGKTTVARALVARQGGQTTFVYLNQSLASAADLRRSLVQALNLGRAGETSYTDLVRDLTRRYGNRREEASPVALIVDEAQSLSDELLEEIRLLTNIEAADRRVMTLALLGQPKLAARLNEEMWAQLKQRIEIRSTLVPLELAETAAYVWSRVRTAGADAAQIFTADAIRLMHDRSRGIPRTISVIAENALVAGFAERERPVTRRLVETVCTDLDLLAQPSEEAPPVAAASVARAPQAPRPPAEPKAVSLPRRELPAGRDRLTRSAETGRRWRWRWLFMPGAWLRS